ncbi:MAG: D-aminoacyl-tRNA deacylase [Eubacteriaceae bacterium]
MRAVIQRVNTCKVIINENEYSCIKNGILIFLGIRNEDSTDDIDYLSKKILNLRIFEDNNKKMNKSILDISGQIMIVSQFTLYGDCKKGRRPSYMRAANPNYAKKLYDAFVEKIKKSDLVIKTGVFRADMKVVLENDGPITILIDSEKKL